MSTKRSKATELVREHVNRAYEALSDFQRDGINANGVLMRPLFQVASLKAAREELSKSIIERTKW